MIGKKQKEKQVADQTDEEAGKITMIRFLDSNVIQRSIEPQIVYSFVATYREGHCRVLELTAEDPLLQALLPKLV